LEKSCEQMKNAPVFMKSSCFGMLTETAADIPNMVEYKDHEPKSWKDLENIRMKYPECRSGLVIGSPTTKAEQSMRKMKAISLTSKMAQKGANVMEPIILGLIFQNATMYGDEKGDVLHLSYFFPFIHSVMMEYMFTESMGFVGDLSKVHFITCAPITKRSWLSLVGLAAAFEARLWLTLGLVSLVSGVSIKYLLQISRIIKGINVKTPLVYIAFAWDREMLQLTK